MSKKIESFNTQPLMIEIEGVIARGVKTILKDFMSRYELLEKTHNTIMNLPSVRNELNKSVDTEKIEAGDDSDKCMNSIIKDTTRNYVREEMGEIEKKLDSILNKIHLLDQEVRALKQVSPLENKCAVKHVIKPSIVSACENENIQVEIKENEDEKEQVEEAADEEEDEEEDDDEEEDNDKDDKGVEEDEEADDSDNHDKGVEEDEEEDEEEDSDNDDKEVEEEEEVTEIEIDDVTYYTNDEENGFIYESTEDNEVGNKVGYLKDGEPFFYADEK